MKKKITYYKKNGDFDHDEILTENSIAHTNGMMIKCHLKNGEEKIGYSDPYRLHDNNNLMEIRDYIYLMTWDNIDEEKHELIDNDESKYNQTFTPVNIVDIIGIEAILHSNPRWGGKLTNLFSFSKESSQKLEYSEDLPDWLKEIYFKKN